MSNVLPAVTIAALLACTTNVMAELAEVPSGDYALDTHHGYISFTYSHMGFSTPHVGFSAFDIDMNLDSGNVENSLVSVEIDTTSIDSRVEEFDGHLQGEDFFDTANFPQATFVSTDIKSTGENTFNVRGDLTIKGVTKSVTLMTTINKAAMHPMQKVPTVGISGETKINRSDFDLGKYVPNVGDEVTISVTAELHKKAE